MNSLDGKKKPEKIEKIKKIKEFFAKKNVNN